MSEIPTDVEAAIRRYGAAAVLSFVASHLASDSEKPSRRESWIAQAESPLGNRRHCACARRLMAEGDPRASKVGRKWLIRDDALEEVLQRMGRSEDNPEDDTWRQSLDDLGLEETG